MYPFSKIGRVQFLEPQEGSKKTNHPSPPLLVAIRLAGCEAAAVQKSQVHSSPAKIGALYTRACGSGDREPRAKGLRANLGLPPPLPPGPVQTHFGRKWTLPALSEVRSERAPKLRGSCPPTNGLPTCPQTPLHLGPFLSKSVVSFWFPPKK